MSNESSIVCIADGKGSGLAAALATGLHYGMIATSPAEAITRISSTPMAAVVIAAKASRELLEAISAQVAQQQGAYIPVLAATADAPDDATSVLRIAPGAPPDRVVARLAAAMRIRALHATVLRRAAAQQARDIVPSYDDPESLDEATVLVTGRGGGYPALATAIGERVNLIGALSFETARHYLESRDIDGVVIGDGFSPRAIEGFIDLLRTDARFRDLPLVVADSRVGPLDFDSLANGDHVRGGRDRVLVHLLPLVRLHAFAARLRRCARALETKGFIDADTGLLTCEAFIRDLTRTAEEAAKRYTSVSLARFSFARIDRHASVDAARIVSRLVRATDFACLDDDGSIHVAFGDTDLRAAHVVARRIASVLKHTMLAPDPDSPRLDPQIALVTRKASDTAVTLMARLRPAPIAAE